MTLIGSAFLRQHVVEFISGSTTGGIWTDGVRDTSQGTSGPYTWTVPNNVAQLTLDASGAGQSGGAGAYQASALSAGGGAGGVNGPAIFNAPASVDPGAQLTITLGAGGTGSAASDGSSNQGGATSIAGLNPGVGVVSGTLTLRATGSFIGNSPTSSTSAIDTNGQGNSTAGAQGTQGTQNLSVGVITFRPQGSGGSPGGGGKASGVAGAGGGFTVFSYSDITNTFSLASWSTGSTGTASGGGSWGGGGRGWYSLFSGVAPAGGNGDAIGTDAGEADYGAGGGGGGGSGTARRRGGNGGNGYVRFTYWSAD